MPFEISWLIDQRVVYIDMSGDIELHEIQQLNKSFKEFYAQGTPPIYVFVDINRVKRAPISIDQIKKINTDSFRQSVAFVLASNATARFVGSLVVQSISREYRFVDTIEVALDYLYRFEPALQPLDLNQILLAS